MGDIDALASAAYASASAAKSGHSVPWRDRRDHLPRESLANQRWFWIRLQISEATRFLSPEMRSKLFEGAPNSRLHFWSEWP
jgi:hypothetical protein